MTDPIITLDKLTYGGDAIGRLPDGRAVFVPFGLPGEKVRIRLVLEKKNFAKAELLEVLEPSPERIAPNANISLFPLPEGRGAGRGCGGCHYQNLTYEAQLEAKTEILRDQLQRIGKIENPPILTDGGMPKSLELSQSCAVSSDEEWKIRLRGSKGKDELFLSQNAICLILSSMHFGRS